MLFTAGSIKRQPSDVLWKTFSPSPFSAFFFTQSVAEIAGTGIRIALYNEDLSHHLLPQPAKSIFKRSIQRLPDIEHMMETKPRKSFPTSFSAPISSTDVDMKNTILCYISYIFSFFYIQRKYDVKKALNTKRTLIKFVGKTMTLACYIILQILPFHVTKKRSYWCM